MNRAHTTVSKWLYIIMLALLAACTPVIAPTATIEPPNAVATVPQPATSSTPSDLPAATVSPAVVPTSTALTDNHLVKLGIPYPDHLGQYQVMVDPNLWELYPNAVVKMSKESTLLMYKAQSNGSSRCEVHLVDPNYDYQTAVLSASKWLEKAGSWTWSYNTLDSIYRLMDDRAFPGFYAVCEGGEPTNDLLAVLATFSNGSQPLTNKATSGVEPGKYNLPYEETNGAYFIRFDPQIWTLDPDAGYGMFSNEDVFLTHKQIDDCKIGLAVDFVPEGLMETPVITQEVIGGRKWQSNNFVPTMSLVDDPIFRGISLYRSKKDKDTCSQDQRTVMTSLSIDPNIPLPTRVVVKNADNPQEIAISISKACPGTPITRLSRGDQAKVLTEVKLRSSPEKSDSNVLGKIGADMVVDIIENPICGKYDGGAYLYWGVNFDYQGKIIHGYLAEGLGSVYYLEPIH